MGQGQSQQQQQEPRELSQEERLKIYEKKFQEAEQVNQNVQQSQEEKVEKVEKVEIIQQQIQQQVKQEYIEPVINKSDQEYRIEKEEEVVQFQQMTPEDVENIWLTRIFQIDRQSQTIKDLKTNIDMKEALTVDFLCDELILGFIQTNEIDIGIRIEWLISGLVSSNNFKETKSQKLVEIPEGEIDQDKHHQLQQALCSFITTLVLYADTLDIQNSKEDNDKLIDFNNKIATLVFENLFDKDNINICLNTLRRYLLYLKSDASTDDRVQIIEMMLKRQLQKMQSCTLLNFDPLEKGVGLLQIIAEFPELTSEILDSSWGYGKFNKLKYGWEFQKYSIIGQALSLTTFPNDNQKVLEYFKSRVQNQIERQMDQFRVRIKKMITQVYELFKTLLKNNFTRIKLIQLISNVIELNLNVEKIYNIDLQRTCCTCGFIHNFTQVLLRLCSQFIEDISVIKNKSKQLDLGLLSDIFRHPLLKKIYSGQDVVAPDLIAISQPEDNQDQPHLLTIMYLLTQRSLHQNSTIIQQYIQLTEQQNRFHQQGNQRYLELFPIRFALESQLFDKSSVEYTVRFLCFQSQVALNLLENPNKPKNPYGSLPTIFIDDIHQYISIFQLSSDLYLYNQEIQIISEFIAITIARRHLINNPHLRVKGIELFHFFLPQKNNHPNHIKNQIFSQIFKESDIVQQYLIEGLMKVFVDCQKTGSHNQYYEKFKYRYLFCGIINYLLINLNEKYSQKLKSVVKEDQKLFLEFAYLYLRDMSDLLEDCLLKMKQMKEIEIEIDQGVVTRQTQHQETEMHLKTQAIFMHEYYKNVQIISEYEPQAFLNDEIRESFVNSMNFTLKQLNGEDKLQYKIKDMKKVNFSPQEIMGNVINLYINYKDYDIFLEQIVMDDRSYSSDLFKQTADLLEKHYILHQDSIDTFRDIIIKLEKIMIEKEEFLKIDGLPSEFVDPIVQTLMTDPVRLPHSHQIVDRVTIKRILFQSKEDPFDRSPLTEDQLIEEPELKQRIMEFKQQQKAKRQQKQFEQS